MIHRFDASTEFEIDERAFIVEMLGSADDAHCSIARARVKPGISTALHRLDGIVERYVILHGHGEVSIGDAAPETVHALDVVTIADGESQKIRNLSLTDDLVFLCVCTPGFRPEAYVRLEQT